MESNAPRAPSRVIASPGDAGAWLGGLVGGLVGATVGGLVWYLGALFLNRVEWLEAYVDALAVLVGVLAARGALRGASDHRGIRTQFIALVVALPTLAVAQAFVVRLDFLRALAELGHHGARLALPLSTYWDYVAWGLFSSNPPALIFWAVAIGYAIAVPRRYEF